MSYAPNPEALRSAFSAGRFAFEETSMQFVQADAGSLAVGNGRIAAGDAQAEEALAPFTQCVPNGDYPVTLARARFENGEERLAYARVLLLDAPAVDWFPALTAGQDARALAPGDIFGNPVESGVACFASGDCVVSFPVGAGGASYASYFGYDAARRVVALVTDFAVAPPVHELPPPRRSWWSRLLFFWK